MLVTFPNKSRRFVEKIKLAAKLLLNLILLSFILTSCKLSESQLSEIELGMNTREVKKQIGRPYVVSTWEDQKDIIEWVYFAVDTQTHKVFTIDVKTQKVIEIKDAPADRYP